jgi:tripartite-type tricarboxylate transporter receptor subunit TctC
MQSWHKSLTLAVAFTFGLVLNPVMAEEYPAREITTINGASAGGGLDTFNRVLASVAEKHLNQPMVVVNKPGGGHMIAVKFVAQSAPDGYTLNVMSAGSAMVAIMLRDFDVDIFDDFEIVAQIGSFSDAIIVKKDGPYQTIQDLIEAAKANPAKLRYGHSGRGNTTHVGMAIWADTLGIEMQDVPFTGGARSRAALLANQIDVVSTGVQQVTGFEDQLRILGVFRGTRDNTVPDVPTLAELGVGSTAETYSPAIIAAPKGTPENIVRYLETAIKAMMEDPELIKAANSAGLNFEYASSDEAEALLRRLHDQWMPAVEKMR